MNKKDKNRMSEAEIQEFIERMEELGDVWEEEDVKRVYGAMSLEEALASRRKDLMTFANIIGTILNRDK